MGFLTYLRLQWDRVGAIACIALGLVALLVGWIGISGTSYVAGQLPYIISGGFTAIILAGVGTTLWLSADLRDDWRELRHLRVLLDDERPASTDLGEVEATEAVAAAVNGTLPHANGAGAPTRRRRPRAASTTGS